MGDAADRGWGSDQFDYAQGRTAYLGPDYDPWGTASTSRRTPLPRRQRNPKRMPAQVQKKHGVVDYGGGLYLPLTGGQVALNPANAPSPSPRDELRAAEELKQSLDARIKVLRERVKKAPNEPLASNKISVKVQYDQRGKWYEFLMLKVPDGRWFTTSSQSETKVFPDWDAVADWLLSDDIRNFTIEALEVMGVPF